MKKYIAPSVKVVNIESNTILAGSTGPGYNTTSSFGEENKVGARGHRGTLTDFDDDED